MVYCPYPRRLELKPFSDFFNNGSTFCSVIERPWVLLRSGFESLVSLSLRTDRNLSNRAKLVSQGWLFKRSWFGRRGWRLRYREIKQRCFFFHDARSQEVGRTHFWLTTPKRLFLKLPIIECISYPCFLCSRCMITGTRPKGSISSFLGVTLVRTS